MDEFDQQSPAPDTAIETAEEPKAQQDRSLSIESALREAKQTADSWIEYRTRIVQDILSLLEIKGFEGQEAYAKREASNPKEIWDKVREVKNELSRSENLGIDDIHQILLTSRLAIRDIQSWLTRYQHEIQLLLSSRDNLAQQNSELSARLAKKNFFARLSRGKERCAISEQLSEVSHQITQIETEIEKRNELIRLIKTAMQEILDKRQELAINAVKQLFEEVIEKYNLLKEELTAPEVKQELNEDLIAQQVMPELERLQLEGRITKEDAEEYLILLKAQLAEGSQTRWDDPIEKKEAVYTRRRRLDELYKSSLYSLEDISYRVSSEGKEPADTYYDRIFDFLIREMTKERVEQLYDTLGGSLNPELQARLREITEEIINPYSDWRTPREQRREILDLSKLPIGAFNELDGLERWRVVKKFAKSSGIIPKEIFSRVEKVIIQRLFEEQLFPGGNSEGGTAAANKMGKLDNPEALPLMLRHIETYGSGYTNNVVVYVMKQLLKASDPAELQQVLESLPGNKRILLETLADENSYMNRFNRINYLYNNFYQVCDLLQDGDRTIQRERYTRILEEEGMPEEELQEFYLFLGDKKKLLEKIKKVAELAREDKKRLINDYFNELTSDISPNYPSYLKIIDLLAKELEVSRSELLVRCVERFENPSRNPTLRKIASPEDQDYSGFPMALAKICFGLDSALIQRLSEIYQTKTLQEGAFNREIYLEGLLFLRQKENGKVVLETLLGAYRGAKDDPSRMRRIFQMLSTLDGFGEYKFVVPSQDEIENINQEIGELQNQSLQTQDNAERKRIKNRIETLTSKVQNLTGLKGIEDAMTQKVVEVTCRRLNLPEEYRDKIENNLERLLKGGVFQIVASLAGKYQRKKEPEVQELLCKIFMHIIDGDFKSWRYSHEQSEAQLAGLTEEQKEFWKAAIEPIIIDVELSEDEKGRREAGWKVVQQMIRNAKEHILELRPDFDFSRERAQILGAKVEDLTKQIKSATSEDEKQRLALEKRKAQAEAALVNGFLEIENATPQSFTRERMLSLARELRERIAELNLPLTGLDIEQIENIFTVGNIIRFTAYESDDPLTLLKVGVEPRETCQSWRDGAYNECLLAYVADSNKKVLNVVDEKGRVVARSIIKLTNQRDENDFESKTQRKTLFVETPYLLLPDSEVYRAFFDVLRSQVYRAFIRVLLTKAQGFDASITLGKGFDKAALTVFEEEARAFGYEMNERLLDVFIPTSLNKYDYSDTLGGKISWFNRYQQFEAVTFEKSKA